MFHLYRYDRFLKTDIVATLLHIIPSILQETMDRLSSIIATQLKPSIKIVRHSSLTQHLVDSDRVILWNDEPTKISKDIYNEFKDALKKRGSRYYMFNHLLPYADFCIALLCSIRYGLNHTVMLSVPDRTFVASWRTIKVVSETSTDSLSNWIVPFIQDRSSEGYCSTLGVSLGNIPNIVDSSDSKHDVSSIITGHMEIIDSLSLRENIAEVKRDVDNTGLGTYSSYNTPEGLVCNLISLSEFINDKVQK